MSKLREGENMNQSDARPSVNYVTCHCQFCGGGIEFDASGFEAGEILTVECPHCHKKTSCDVQMEKRLSKLNRLTPKLLSDFIGQNRVKARLELATAAAKRRRESLGHVLLIGSPGSGKATLANILASEMGANIKSYLT